MQFFSEALIFLGFGLLKKIQKSKKNKLTL